MQPVTVTAAVVAFLSVSYNGLIYTDATLNRLHIITELSVFCIYSEHITERYVGNGVIQF